MNPIGAIHRTPGNRPALVLVTGHLGNQFAVTLLSPDLELGTNLDIILTPDSTGLPYTLMAEADIFGYTRALGALLGRVSEETVRAVISVRNDDQVGLPAAGPPILSKTDPRWAFKIAELGRLRVAVRTATRQNPQEGEPCNSAKVPTSSMSRIHSR